MKRTMRGESIEVAMSHPMNVPKQIEFEYNLADQDRDVVIDIEGTMPCCEVGDILMRRSRSWKVTQVLSEQSDLGANRLPTLYVSLSDRF